MPSTHQSIDIEASVPEVWAKLSDFHDFSWAPNVVESVEKVGNVEGTEVGAKRILNQAFHETLVDLDHENYELKYSIDDGPSPVSKNEVSNYYGVVRLTATDDGNGTHVEWSSSWEADTEDAVAFCHKIYVGLLEELAESFK